MSEFFLGQNTFPNFFLMYWNFFYVHDYITKVIHINALKLFRRENKSIKINPFQFSTRPKIQYGRHGTFFNKKKFDTNFILKIHLRPFRMKKIVKKKFSQRALQISTRSEIQDGHHGEKNKEHIYQRNDVMTSLC